MLQETQERTRTRPPKAELLRQAIQHPMLVVRELNNRSFYNFFKFFWPEVSADPFVDNWHIPYLCGELQGVAERAGGRQGKEHDLLINIPPGMTKTTLCSVLFPVWCWTRWPWMEFICVSYSAQLSLEAAEASRDVIRSSRFEAVYPEYRIKDDKDTKSNFRILRTEHIPGRRPRLHFGGSRFSTSVGGSLTGFHGHIIIWDDPINPQQAVSDGEIKRVDHWLTQTLSTRKADKLATPIIGVMQRLHQRDPSGTWLERRGEAVRHICLPGEIRAFGEYVRPAELASRYQDGLLDPIRLGDAALAELEADLGQYGYAGQVGQNPTPAAGGMFRMDMISVIPSMPPAGEVEASVRYWDKAATPEGKGAFTVGVLMHRLRGGKYLVGDVKRGRWGSGERERIIRATAEADGVGVRVAMEQEPGSGGKESAEATVRNLAGFAVSAECPTGNKVQRADPFSVQVNWGNVQLLAGDWHQAFLEELRYFPVSAYKDQVDAASGAFSQLVARRRVRVL